MNYIELINHFWQTRRSKRITSTQADLYFFLLQESNSRDWENPFECSNGTICASIGISDNTLLDARNGLQQRGLIEFKPGIKNVKSPVYYLKFCGNTGGKRLGNTGGNNRGNKVGNKADINTLNKTKQNKDDVKQFFILTFLNLSMDNIKIYPDEYEKLTKEFTEHITNESIKFLSAYKIEKGYTTKSDYLTIRRWVINAVKEKIAKGNIIENQLVKPLSKTLTAAEALKLAESE